MTPETLLDEPEEPATEGATAPAAYAASLADAQREAPWLWRGMVLASIACAAVSACSPWGFAA